MNLKTKISLIGS